MVLGSTALGQIRFPAGIKDISLLQTVQTGSATHAAYQGLFPWGENGRASSWTLTSI